jgi:microcystin-dependent protein
LNATHHEGEAMKIKVVVVDMEISRRGKRILATIAASVAVVVGGAIAFASVPHSWSSGERLMATDLNANFSALDARATALEGQVAALQAEVALPGMIITFAGPPANLPAGWLVCDGSEVKRSVYPGLFAAIGTSWGSGDGATSFNLPDLRGRFLRGVDQGQGRDPDAATRTASANGGNVGDMVGSLEADAFKSHVHTLLHAPDYDVAAPAGGLYNGGSYGDSAPSMTEAAGGSETRPVNAGVIFLIRT